MIFIWYYYIIRKLIIAVVGNKHNVFSSTTALQLINHMETNLHKIHIFTDAKNLILLNK